LHVGNDVYHSALLEEGLNSRHLPIFSNIPQIEPQQTDWIYEKTGLNTHHVGEYIVFAFFGTIHPFWDVEQVIGAILKSCEPQKAVFLSIGSQGYGGPIWEKMAASFQAKASFCKLGYLDANKISEVLHFADYGFCTTPLSLLGKSGTVMAMLEHGLRVIVTREELHYRFPLKTIEPTRLGVLAWQTFDKAQKHDKLPPIAKSYKEVAARFLDDLKAAEKSANNYE